MSGHVACRGRREVYTGVWWGNLREGDHLEEPGVDGRIILRWMLRKWDVGAWTVSIWLRIGIFWRAFVNALVNLRVQ